MSGWAAGFGVVVGALAVLLDGLTRLALRGPKLRPFGMIDDNRARTTAGFSTDGTETWSPVLRAGDC